MGCEIMSFEELRDEIRIRTLCSKIKQWTITESFTKNGIRHIVVRNLRLLLDNDIVMLVDQDDILLHSGLVSCIFLRHLVLKIEQCANYLQILFDSGTIKIEG